MPSNRYTSLPVDDGNPHETSSSQNTSSNNFQQEEPSDLPPAYEASPDFQEFEIEEDEDIVSSNHNIRTKAGLLADSFNRRFVQPISNAIDPVYQLYCYTNAKFEQIISKMGNPLIVKRILYIVIVSGILYIASLSGLRSEGVVGGRSDFADHNKLSEYVNIAVDPKRLEENLEYISSMPHLAGTVGDLVLSKYFQDLINHSHLELNNDIAFEAYTNYPLEPKVQFLKNGDVLIDCDLKEDVDDNVENDFYKLAFNPGSKDMTVKGGLVYANYGTISDYNLLHDKGIDINGKIVIMKYGGIYPAHKKLHIAQEQGAAGVLFISDPELDMYYNMESLQREPVAFSHKFPGNMVLPGIQSSKFLEEGDNIDQLLNEGGVMPKIPSLPIKWKDFVTIMQELSQGDGIKVPEWDISIKGQKVTVTADASNHEILLQNKLTQMPAKDMWTVVGKLQGSEQDSFSIVIGASRDSSCYGAMEGSGTAILLELINVFNEMSRSMFWRPLRTIYFVSYTGSKYNFAGATNFAIRNSEFFRRDVYSFIDLDDIIQGDDLVISADPLFQKTVYGAVEKVISMNSSSHILFDPSKINYKLTSLSSAYNLIEHFNIGAISMKLTNDASKSLVSQYAKNSCMDTFKNFKDNGIDPDMSKHVFMTKLVAEVAIAIADTPILPYEVEHMIEKIRVNMEAVKQYVNENGRNLNFGAFDQYVAAIKIIGEQNSAFTKTWYDICDGGRGPEPSILSVNRWDWNAKLLLMNKVMINIDGGYQNPWNHNLLYGIEAQPENHIESVNENNANYYFPSLWDAINNGENDEEIQRQLDNIVNMLDNCVGLFDY